MSHTMNIKTEIKDLAALAATCDRLGYKLETNSTFNLYSSQESGAGVYLPGWRFPVVVDQAGVVHYDNYGGRWGEESELHKLEAYYGLEKAKLEAYKQGYSVIEGFDSVSQELTLQIQVGV